MVDTDRQKGNSENTEMSCSSRRKSNDQDDPECQVKDEVSDEVDSAMSDINPPSLATRARRRKLERRKASRAASSNSSAFGSDARKTRSEPILITIDSDSDDNISIVSCRPNRTAKLKGDLIRKLSRQQVRSCARMTSYKDTDSSSFSESEKVKKKKKAKTKSLPVSSVHAKRKKFLVNQLKKKTRLRLRQHSKPHRIYNPMKKTRRLKIRSLRKRFERQKNDKQECKRQYPITRRNSQLSSTSVERKKMPTRGSISEVETAPKSVCTSSNVACSKDSEPALKIATNVKSEPEPEPKPEKAVDKIESPKPNTIAETEVDKSNTTVETFVSKPSTSDKTTPDNVVENQNSASSKPAKSSKNDIKPIDKIIRKRGRPRLCDSKPVKVMPFLNDKKHMPFLQNSYCFDVAPKLPKCRECRIAVNRNRRMMHAYCRFMEYRKLYYNKAGAVLNAGFSEPSDANVEHLNQWLPQSHDPPKDLNCETAKSLLEHIGDQFCDLIEQEKEALSLHIGCDKVITWKRIVQGVREMCDVCSTTIFNIHWVCPICGLAVCIDCYKVRKQGIIVEDDEEQPKNRDEYKWLLCTMRQPHDQEKLVMAQIIPGNALWRMRELLHKARKKWNIPSYCKCNPTEVSALGKQVSTGICKQLMSFVTKSFTIDQIHVTTTTAKNNNKGEEEKNRDENKFEALDITVCGSALKWLGDTNLHKKTASLEQDEYLHNYEDFALLRSNLLHGFEDEESASESEREFSSFSLDDIISCVKNNENSDGKEGPEKTMVKHFSQRYPQANSGRDPLPIRIYTKIESTLAFNEVPHSWFCNGRLLFLHKAEHIDNLSLFQEQWKRGQPILVKGVEEGLDMNLWHPDGFCRDFGEVKNDLVDCRTGAIIKNLPMKRFWEGFENFSKRMKDENGEYMLLKLKDWPPGEDFSEKLPRRFQDLMKGLPLPEYTHRDGVLNLAGRLPPWFVRPDLGPKMYNAYGSALYPAKGTTNLHLDVSDAVNVMVYVGIPSDGNAQVHIQEALKAIDEGGCDSLMRARVRARAGKPGALWHIYNARDADKIRDMLTKVALEKGEKLEAHHDPIHDQSWYIDAELRKRLYQEYGVEGYAIAQCLGDAVFIPAGAPHQVRNLHSCVKVAEDFVSPENIAHCFKLTQEFRNLSDTHTNHEDKLQIKNIIYHVVRDALSHLLPNELDS